MASEENVIENAILCGSPSKVCPWVQFTLTRRSHFLLHCVDLSLRTYYAAPVASRHERGFWYAEMERSLLTGPLPELPKNDPHADFVLNRRGDGVEERLGLTSVAANGHG